MTTSFFIQQNKYDYRSSTSYFAEVQYVQMLELHKLEHILIQEHKKKTALINLRQSFQ